MLGQLIGRGETGRASPRSPSPTRRPRQSRPGHRPWSSDAAAIPNEAIPVRDELLSIVASHPLEVRPIAGLVPGVVCCGPGSRMGRREVSGIIPPNGQGRDPSTGRSAAGAADQNSRKNHPDPISRGRTAGRKLQPWGSGGRNHRWKRPDTPTCTSETGCASRISSVRLTNAEAALRLSAGRGLQTPGRVRSDEMAGVENARSDIESFHRPASDNAIPPRDNPCGTPARGGRRTWPHSSGSRCRPDPLAGRLEVGRRLQAVGRLGEQGRNSLQPPGHP